MQGLKAGISSTWYLSAAFALLGSPTSAAKSHIEIIEVTERGARIVTINGATAHEFTIWSGPGTQTGLGKKAVMSTSAGDLADWIAGVVSLPRGLPVFDVSFLCEACEPARSDTWRCYGVRYAMGANGQGFIQIPPTADEQFPLNVQTIYRGVEGQWFRASPKWEKLIRPVIEKARAAL